MKKFDRIDGYIVDLEEMHLINTDNNLLYKFDFDDMTVRKITAQSKAAYPIRYDENTNSMMVWKQRRWQAIGDSQKAIMYMFNAKVEQHLLED